MSARVHGPGSSTPLLVGDVFWFEHGIPGNVYAFRVLEIDTRGRATKTELLPDAEVLALTKALAGVEKYGSGR